MKFEFIWLNQNIAIKSIHLFITKNIFIKSNLFIKLLSMESKYLALLLTLLGTLSVFYTQNN